MVESRSLLIVALLCTLIGCSAPDDPLETTLTAADSAFAVLLVDLHGADVDALNAMENEVFARDDARRDSVLRANGLDETSFQEKVTALSSDPERLVAIYDRAIDIAAIR